MLMEQTETPRVRGVVNLESLEASITGWKTGVVVYASRPAEATLCLLDRPHTPNDFRGRCPDIEPIY